MGKRVKKRGAGEGSAPKWRGELGVYEKRVYMPVKLRHLYGGLERKSVYAKREGDVIAKAKALQRDIDEGRGRNKDLTVGTYLTRWLDSLEALGAVSERTLQDYRYYAEKHLIPRLGALPLEDLTAEDLDGLYARLMKEGTGPRSVNHVHATARVALQRAVKKRLIPYNPARDADPPRYSTDDREYALLSSEQVARFLEAAKGDRFEALWVMAVLAGPRPAELRALKWEDLSLDSSAGTALMWRSVVELKGEPPKIKNATKAGKGRLVPLLPEVVSSLKAHRVRQNAERLRLGKAGGSPLREGLRPGGLWEDNDLVFPTTTGTIVRRANLTNRHYKPILKKAGLPNETRLYDLRHTFATLWVEAGERIEMLSGVLGHARISTTSDRYIHPSDSARSDAMRRFGKGIFGSR